MCTLDSLIPYDVSTERLMCTLNSSIPSDVSTEEQATIFEATLLSSNICRSGLSEKTFMWPFRPLQMDRVELSRHANLVSPEGDR
jgi:hypothetical protein